MLSTRVRRRSIWPVWTGILLASAAACDGSSTEPAPPQVSTVLLTSPIDSVMAAGWSTQLGAEARDGSGNAVPNTSFTWRSTNANVATVSPSGVVQAIGPGATTIEAEASDVLGSLRMRVVPADLAAIDALLHDPFTEGVLAALGEEARDPMEAVIDACIAALGDGHVLNLNDCLAELGSGSASGGTDQVLLTYLEVVALRSGELLGL